MPQLVYNKVKSQNTEATAMLFRKKIERSCAYCLYGAHLEDEVILCQKKGMRTTLDQCRKFRYDPCKRIPKKEKALDLAKYDEEDFSL